MKYLVFFLSLCLVVSCTKNDKENQNYIAKIGDTKISQTEFDQYMMYRPISAGKEINEEAVKKRLDEMVVSEILYQEAIRNGIDQDPAIRRRIQQILSQRLMIEKVEKAIWKDKISNQEIKEYFNQHKYQFVRPQEAKIADIFIKAQSKSEKKIKRNRALEALDEAKKIEGKWAGFGPLIKKYSDKHDNYPTGAPGYFDDQGKPAGIHENVAKAAFSLKMGKIHKTIIETPEGFHIIMLTGKRPGVNSNWQKEQHRIKRAIRSHKLEQAKKEYIKNLREKTKPILNDQQISLITHNLKNKRIKTSKPSKKPPALPGG